jgi:fumarate hydratase subunit alpha
MRLMEAGALSAAVRDLYIEANLRLPEDVRQAILRAREAEPWPAGRDALDRIIANFELAAEQGLPLCQDTGIACVFLEIGADLHITGDIRAAVDEGIRRASGEGFLRASVVADPLRRTNTGDNTPALLYLDLVPGDKLGVTVAPKGFGAENMGCLRMLSPAEGRRGLVNFVLAAVEAAGPNPCPPIVVGVGAGGSFDKAAFLAKKALLRPLDQRHRDPFYAELEAELLETVNRLGIGPAGYGGASTALAVAVEVMATHIAGLPCAVNINCHAARHASALL